jgi:hypothetical protein
MHQRVPTLVQLTTYPQTLGELFRQPMPQVRPISTQPLSAGPSARSGPLVGFGDDNLLVAGGASNATDAYLFNITTSTWTQISSLPVTISHGSTSYLDGKFFVWGGYSTGGFLNQGYIYTVSTNSWSAITTSGSPGVSLENTMRPTDQGFVLWGGQSSSAGAFYNTLTSMFTAIPDGSGLTGRHQSAIAWDGCDLIVWGGSGFSDGAIYSVGP